MFLKLDGRRITKDEGPHFAHRGLGAFGVTAGNKALAAIPICR
jgi:hypothetical protein